MLPPTSLAFSESVAFVIVLIIVDNYNDFILSESSSFDKSASNYCTYKYLQSYTILTDDYQSFVICYGRAALMDDNFKKIRV